jgi:uncharacterized protein YbcI
MVAQRDFVGDSILLRTARRMTKGDQREPGNRRRNLHGKCSFTAQQGVSAKKLAIRVLERRWSVPAKTALSATPASSWRPVFEPILRVKSSGWGRTAKYSGAGRKPWNFIRRFSVLGEFAWYLRPSVEVIMKTQGEIEAAICEGINRFELEYMGRGTKEIHAHLFGDCLVIRLYGALTAAERQLVKSLPAEKGRDLLKQVRTHLIETARPVMESMIEEITGVKVVSLHHDISTTTGEKVLVFTLAEPPNFRDMRKK